MGILQKVFKSNDDRYKPQYADTYSDIIYGDNRSYTVTEEQAMQIPAVKSSVELIASTISSLPIYLYREMVNGDLEDISDKRVSLLNNRANKYDTASKVKKLLVKDLLLHGRAYLFREGDQLKHLPAKNMEARATTTEDGILFTSKRYVYNGLKTINLTEDQVIVFETGTEGVLVDGELILNQAINELEYSKNVLSNGALPVGVLQVASRLTETAINRLRGSFENLYSGAKKAGKTLILEEGMEYKPVSLNPNELQLNETSKHTLASIARLFNVPQALIDSNANKYASLEMQNMQFLQYSLNPLIDVMEKTLSLSLLQEYEQKDGLKFKFDTSEILRATEKELVETTINLLDKGVISMNEARARLHYKRVEKDYFKDSLGTVYKDAETGELTIPNMGIFNNQKQDGGATNENGNENEPSNSNI